jgi:hypothetical protein
VVFDESGAGTLAFDLQTVASMFGCGIFVGGTNEGDDELLNRVEEL